MGKFSQLTPAQPESESFMPATPPARPRRKSGLSPASPASPAAPVDRDAEPRPRTGRPRRDDPRIKRTIYMSAALIAEVEKRHLQMEVDLGRFPLSNVLDAIFSFALERWDEVATTVVVRDDRKP